MLTIKRIFGGGKWPILMITLSLLVVIAGTIFYIDRMYTRQSNVYEHHSSNYGQQIEWLWSSTKLGNRYITFVHAVSNSAEGTLSADATTLLDEFNILWSWFDTLKVFSEFEYADVELTAPTASFTEHLAEIRPLAASVSSKGMAVLERLAPSIHALERASAQDLQTIVQSFEELSPLIMQLQDRIMVLMRNTLQLHDDHTASQHKNLSAAYILISLLTTLLLLGALCALAIRKNQSHNRLHVLYTDKTRHAEELDRLAHQDSLSGVLNRAGFFREFEALFDVPGQHGICFIDIDRFKMINDTAGHVAGDELVRQLGAFLEGRCAMFSDGCVAARYGGDEFVLLLKHCDTNDFETFVHTVLDDMSPFEFKFDGRSFDVDASLGAHHFDVSSSNLESVMVCVDAACYEAKNAGGSRLCFHSAEDGVVEARRADLVAIESIQNALANDTFQLHVQPIVELLEYGFRPHSYEGLIRMLGSDGELIFPGDFLPVAERYGFMSRIDKWVVRAVLRWLEINDLESTGTRFININLCGSTISDEDSIAEIIDLFAAYNVNVSQLCLEVTESSAMHGKALQNLQRLADAGVQLSLDDFGSGFSSFGYLEKIPVSQIKIDGGFIKDLDTNPVHQEFVRALATLGKALGKFTIGEFVENEASRKLLWELGIDAAQGYYIGKPAPMEQLVLIGQESRENTAVAASSSGDKKAA